MSSKTVQIEKVRAVTEPYQELARRRIENAPGFAGALLQEAVACLLQNDVITAQLLLRDITKFTVGFPALAGKTGIMEKSLMRMLSVKGNPQARNLFTIIDALQRLNGLQLEVRAV